ncbi:hypothetical protein EH165_07200 [Nakamurella antarctica]|uniref:Bacterial Ig-like domain-containing protein n=1 Tax=Nakamurella antarctica TaxID=1902245 RepID=A0A3G8ZKW8_9ACTN|nr:hypothetical protein [Nakamurella antarctica]AZI57959.1 hypothetical protein EH165_07200 [Nakamurella antarctica]
MTQVSLPSMIARITAVTGLVLGSIVLGTGAASAAQPVFSAPTDVVGATNLPLPFTGVDPLTSNNRAIVLTTADSTNCAPQSPGYFITGCARIQMTTSHGNLSIAGASVINSPNAEALLPGGAIAVSSQNGNATGKSLNINGTMASLNAAMANLVYTPDNGFESVANDSNKTETLHITVTHPVTANSTDNSTKDVNIMIKHKNVGPTLTVPAGPYAVAGGSTTYLPVAAPAMGDPGDFSVSDPDIGNDQMLLVVAATCGQVRLRGGQLTIENDIKQLLIDQAGFTPALADTVVGLLPASISGQTFATGNPSDPHEAIAAIGSLKEVNYALSQIGFVANNTTGDCQLITFVHDLGHNGLPVSAVGGVEIPDLTGADFGTVTFSVKASNVVSLPKTLTVPEGGSIAIPVSVSDTTHAAFSPVLVTTPGTATLADYTPATSPLVFLANTPNVKSTLLTTVDALVEGDETLTVSLDPDSIPAGMILGNDTVTITITDTPVVPPADTTAPTVTVEQAAGQSDPASSGPLRFTLKFSEPVTIADISQYTTVTSTAGGTLDPGLTGSGDTYEASISLMTTPGIVTFSLLPGFAKDTAGNLSKASTSIDNTITWAPVVATTTGTTTSGTTTSGTTTSGTTTSGTTTSGTTTSGTTTSGTTTSGTTTSGTSTSGTSTSDTTTSGTSTSGTTTSGTTTSGTTTSGTTTSGTTTSGTTTSGTTTSGTTTSGTSGNTSVRQTTATVGSTTLVGRSTGVITPSQRPTSTLAVTGVQVGTQLWIGFALVLLGVGCAFLARRRVKGGSHIAR